MNQVKILIVSAPQDLDWRKLLVQHLNVLMAPEIITYCRSIYEADIVLLLVSAHAIADSAVLRLIVQCGLSKGRRLIPILLSECQWERVIGLGNLVPTPQNEKPIRSWATEPYGIDRAYAAVAEDVLREVRKLSQRSI